MEFNIRKNAMVVLANIYQNCNGSLMVTDLNIEKLFQDRKHRWQYINYLRDSGFIIEVKHDHPGMTVLSCKLTFQGINAMEDYSAQGLFDDDLV